MVWLIALFIVIAIWSAVLKVRAAHSDVWPIEPKRPLSIVEQKLYWRLVQSLPDYAVLAQVQLSQMMSVKRVPQRRTWLNRINQKSADFVVCNKDFSVAAVIELDDSTHDRANRRKADADKDAALSAAGILVIRWNVKAIPDEQTIRQAIKACQKSA